MPSKEEQRLQDEKEKLELQENRKSMHTEVNVEDYIIGKTDDSVTSKDEVDSKKKKQIVDNDAFEI